MIFIRALILMCLSVILAGCNPESPSEAAMRWVGPEIEAQTRQAAEVFLSGDVERIKNIFPAGMSEEAHARLVTNIETEIPKIIPEPITGEIFLISANVGKTKSMVTGEASAQYRVNYEVEASDGTWPVVMVQYVENVDGLTGVANINLRPSDIQLSTANALSGVEIDGKRMFISGIAVINVLFIFFTLFKIVTDKGLRKKWLWFIFAMFGLWGIVLNWNTGAISPSFFQSSANGVHVSLLDASLFGAGFTSNGQGGPWMLEIGLPLGALIYWWTRRKRDLPNAGSAASP